MTDLKVRPDRHELVELLRSAGVPAPETAQAAEIAGGTFNTSYRIVADRNLVLKIAPLAEVAGLSYEHDLLATEAAFYRAAAKALPVPEVVHTDFSTDLLPTDWLLMTECPGVNWFDHRERIGPRQHRTLRGQLGSYVAALHKVTGDGFGYPQNGLVASWREAFTAMMRAVLDDAARYGVAVPDGLDQLAGAELDEVVEPTLVHFDLWPGNILVDLDQVSVTGVIDGERSFWGDPLADLASPALFGRIEDDPDFLEAYQLELTPSVLRRLDLYRCYLYLIMTVETVPRGARNEPLSRLVNAHLRQAVERLAT